MKVRLFVMIASLTIVALIGAPYASAGPSNITNYSFEQNLTPMLPDGNLGHSRSTLTQGEDPATVCVFDPEYAHHYALLTADLNNSYIVWFETSFHAEGPVVVQLTWNARNVYNCAGCTLLAYAGEYPAVGEDLQRVGRLGPQWQQYKYLTNLELQNTGYVAIGFRFDQTRVPPELSQVGIDCLSIRVDSNARPGK